jgi:2-polyprenyl-3-methyl-5-hydroxy-6-metoxy-1,4-benzoquinol methylase
VVTVPNEGCAHCLEQVREFDRRKLAKLLKGYGKPRLATDQPFRWITMYVEKPRGRRARRNRTRIDRWRVTARLCRGRVIELGCNEGDLSGRIAERGLEVTGVDLSEEKIRRAREKHPEIPFLASDIRRLALSPGSFDTVVLAEVLEHVHAAEGDEMLAVAWNLLKPGGRLIVSVPNEDCIPHPHHVRRFDRRSLKRLLAPFGRPRLMLEQPYKWLLMVVRKAARAG